MAGTQIRGSTQIQPITIADAQVATAAAIQTSKLQDGALFVKSDGSVAMAASLNLASHTITNVTDPVNPQDAATRAWVLANTGGTGDMTKAVYDTDNNGKVDTADSIPWGSVSGKPSSFAPSAHALTHLDNGADSVPVVTTVRTGLTPILSGDANTFFNGVGGYSAPQTLFQGQWNYRNILTMVDPGAGNLRFNTATATSITQMAIDVLTAIGVDRTNVIKSLKNGDTIQIQDATNVANWGRYILSADAVDNAGWFLLPVTYVTGSGTAPANNNLLTISFTVSGGAAGGGDMTKAVYDSNNDNIVDHAALADAAPWTGITGKPATFPPDSTAMLKSVYDTNGDGISDHAALADSVPWTGVSGKPATFPPDSTAMLKSVYDTNADNVVDHAALADTATNANAVPWAGVTGKPSTFPPDSTAMLKSVYDTNANNKVDSAESADAVPWTGVTGKPALFTPSAHEATHLDNGTDPIPVVSTARTGLAPKLNGNVATFLDGTGGFSTPAGTAPVIGFIAKSGAYTLTSADSAKVVICSGGSWTLTLPTPAVGLNYSVRNDQTCFGTTGTITISPTGGTIDGKASITLLPQQECQIVTDGTNWRTFGLQREVILGTQDITSSTANAFVLLPVGFRSFELVWNACLSSTANTVLIARLSTDGGSTWITTGYDYGLIYPSSATAVAYSQATGGAAFTIGAHVSLNNGTTKLLLYPGSGTTYPTWIGDSTGWRSTDSVISVYRSQGFYVGNVLANALQYYFSAGNITNSFLTVKGVT